MKGVVGMPESIVTKPYDPLLKFDLFILKVAPALRT